MRKKYEVALEPSEGTKAKDLMGALREVAEKFGGKVTIKPANSTVAGKPAVAKKAK